MIASGLLKTIKNMKKITIRKYYLQKRLDLTQSEYEVLNVKMMGQVAKMDWGIYKNIHLFLSIAKHNEVDTFSMINYWREEYPQLQIIIPRTDFEKNEMEHVLFDPEQILLKKNKFDIPEPIGGRLFPVEQIDLVLVPLLAFDKKGFRLGRGGGHYDKLLAKYENVYTIGVCFNEQITLSDLPTESHDKRVQKVCAF